MPRCSRKSSKKRHQHRIEQGETLGIGHQLEQVQQGWGDLSRRTGLTKSYFLTSRFNHGESWCAQFGAEDARSTKSSLALKTIRSLPAAAQPPEASNRRRERQFGIEAAASACPMVGWTGSDQQAPEIAHRALPGRIERARSIGLASGLPDALITEHAASESSTGPTARTA